MTRRFAPEVLDALPCFRRGLVELHRAQAAYETRTSPRGRAGRLGGLVSARLHPDKTRDARGRFTGDSRLSRPTGAVAQAPVENSSQQKGARPRRTGARRRTQPRRASQPTRAGPFQRKEDL